MLLKNSLYLYLAVFAIHYVELFQTQFVSSPPPTPSTHCLLLKMPSLRHLGNILDRKILLYFNGIIVQHKYMKDPKKKIIIVL